MFYSYMLYYVLGFVMIPGIILGILAQVRVMNTFNQYNSISTSRGRSAKDVARLMLNGAGYYETNIKEVNGHLNDNYNPRTDIVSLSSSVSNSSSIAAIGVAAHEIGHVFQHKQKYLPVKIRTALISTSNITSYLMWPLIIIGFILEFVYYSTFSSVLIYIGLGIYALNTLICLVTLPVELNASKKAYKMLIATSEMDEKEAKAAKKVLNAAALTYVAALITSILSLLRLVLFILTMRGDRR